MLNGTDRFSDEISFADDVASPSTPASARERQAIPVIKTAAPDDSKPYAKQNTRTAADEAGRVDSEGAKRAAADEALAKSLGFSPKPPVFEIGTTVNSVGVDNFRRSRTDFEKQPSLPELARSFSDRIAKEQRDDVLVDADALTLLPTGRMAHKDKPTTVMMSERALDGLATHVTPGGSSYLKQCPADLRATNLNHWLTNAQRLDARATKKAGEPVYKPQQLTLRTRARKGANGADREIYSVVGPKYAAFNVDRVAREAAAGIGGDARGVITYDGYKMTLDAIFHSNIAPERAVAGEFFKGCVRIQAADDGTGSVKVSLGLWRNLCRNLIIVDFNKVLVGSRKHVGAATIEEDIRELMIQANERIGLIVGKWSEASTEDVLARYDLTDVDQVFEGLVLNGCVHAPNVKPADLVKRLHESWEREPGYSKTAILNAITRAAHEHMWSSWADTEELESQAGELLYQKVWTLDTAERSAEEVLA